MSDWEYFLNEVKNKPVEKIPAGNIEKSYKKKMERTNTMPIKNLTWKSILILVFVTVLKAVLNLWFDPAITESIMKVVYELLGLIQGVSVAGALWGIRRSNGEYV